MTIFIATLFVIAKSCKQSKYSSTDKWVNKIWYTHTVEYYSSVKKNEILTYSTTRMNLDNIMLSKKKSQKGPHIVWYHLYEISAQAKL